jgi:hypothetical protein
MQLVLLGIVISYGRRYGMSKCPQNTFISSGESSTMPFLLRLSCFKRASDATPYALNAIKTLKPSIIRLWTVTGQNKFATVDATVLKLSQRLLLEPGNIFTFSSFVKRISFIKNKKIKKLK